MCFASKFEDLLCNETTSNSTRVCLYELLGSLVSLNIEEILQSVIAGRFMDQLVADYSKFNGNSIMLGCINKVIEIILTSEGKLKAKLLGTAGFLSFIHTRVTSTEFKEK